MLPTNTQSKKMNTGSYTPDFDQDDLSGGITLIEYVAILRRRRAIIIQAFILIAVVGIAVTMLTKPVYQATGELLVDAPGYNVNQVDSNNPLSGLLTINQPQSPATVVEVLQTPQLVSRVTSQPGDGPADFDVNVKKDTNVIEILTEAGDAKTAAAADNELMRQYISQEADADLSGLENNYEFIRRQMASASTSFRVYEAKLQNFRNKNNLVEFTRNRDEKLGRVSSLSVDLENQQIQHKVLEAQIVADEKEIAKQSEAIAVILPSTNPRISILKDQIANLQVQMDAMTQAGGFARNGVAPQLLAIKSQIATLTHQLKSLPPLVYNQSSNVNAVHENLRAQLVDLHARESPTMAAMTATESNLAVAKAELAKFPNWEMIFDKLTLEVDNARAAKDSLGKQLADLSLREQARHPNAHVIQSALIPQTPIRPKKALNILFSCLIGLFIGICLALLQEFLDDRINTTEDADRVLGLPSLGYVPLLTANDARLLPQMQALDPSWESYRVLRTNIHFASIDSPLRSLLVTSSGAGEGKTTTAVNLAFAMVMDGKKVILLDTDLRRPSVHKMLGLPAMPGVTDVLLGHANLSDVIMQHSDMPGLMALTCGSTPPNPSELLGSRAFKGLVEELTRQADLVILDSPPVLAAADAQILAAQVDGVVMVIETGETKKSAARHSLSLLRHARANVLGVAHNRLRVLNYYYNYYQSPTPPTGLPGDTGSGTKAQKSLPAAAEPDEQE